MSRPVHHCGLRLKNTYGLKPLPPNASWLLKFQRKIRLICAVNPSNVRCAEFFRSKSAVIAERNRFAASPHVFIIHPFSQFYAVYEIVFFVLWTWRCVYVFLMYLFVVEYNESHVLANTIISFFQMLVIICTFFVGYIDAEKNIIIIPKKVVLHYIKTYFIFDVAGVLFHRILERIFSFNYLLMGLSRTAWICRYTITIIPCIVRLKTLLDILRSITLYFKINKNTHLVIYHIVKSAFILHFASCAIYTIPTMIYRMEKWGTPEKSWFVQAGIDIKNKPTLWKLYTECVLMVTSYIFGVHNKAYNVTLPMEQVALISVSFFGRLYSLYMLADLLNTFGIVGVAESRYEQYLMQLREYMRAKNLPEELRAKLLMSYEYKLQKHYFNEPEILATLSEQLKREVFLYGARNLIEKATIFRTVPPITIGTLFSHMQVEIYLPKEFIYKSGDVAIYGYFISVGSVAIIAPNGRELTHYEDGESFAVHTLGASPQFTIGESPTFKYSAVAVETTELYYIKPQKFFEILQDIPEVMRYFLQQGKERAMYFHSIEEMWRKGGADVVSELKSENLLEHVTNKAQHYNHL